MSSDIVTAVLATRMTFVCSIESIEKSSRTTS